MIKKPLFACSVPRHAGGLSKEWTCLTNTNVTWSQNVYNL